jgi:hypothetical protein
VSIVIECRGCHATYEPTREEAVFGAWNMCVACRRVDAPGGRVRADDETHLMSSQTPLELGEKS